MIHRRHRVSPLLALLVLLYGTTLAPAPAGAEWSSTIYLGYSVTADAPYIVNGAPLPPSLVCISQCSSAKSAVGGVRVGYWLEGLPWLGFAGDVSAFVSGWGIESPYEVTAFPVTPLVLLRLPLVKREGFENGRVRPFAALGPSLLVSTAAVTSGWAILGNTHSADTITADFGLDARLGIEFLPADWFGVAIEYRYFWSEPTWTIEGQTIESEISANQLSLGLVAHY